MELHEISASHDWCVFILHSEKADMEQWHWNKALLLIRIVTMWLWSDQKPGSVSGSPDLFK